MITRALVGLVLAIPCAVAEAREARETVARIPWDDAGIVAQVLSSAQGLDVAPARTGWFHAVEDDAVRSALRSGLAALTRADEGEAANSAWSADLRLTHGGHGAIEVGVYAAADGFRLVTEREGRRHWKLDDAAGEALRRALEPYARRFRDPRNGLPPDAETIAFAAPEYAAAGHLPLLAELPRLRALDLAMVPVGDDDLAVLAKLPQLEYLQLRGSRGYGANQVTDAGIEHVLSLGSLEVLRIGATDITSAGVARLAALPLERLHLDSCEQLNDAALAHLHDCARLRLLDLFANEQLSGAAIAAFARARPDCTIVLPDGGRLTWRRSRVGGRAFVPSASWTGHERAAGEPAVHVVTDSERFGELWREVRGDEPLPEVDFRRDAALIVFVGRRRVWAELELEQQVRDDQIRLTYLIGGPSGVMAEECSVWGIWVVPRPDRPVVVRESFRAGPGPASLRRVKRFSPPR